MRLDILIFAIIAAFLIYRLKMVLGTRQGHERPRQNPFTASENGAAVRIMPPLKHAPLKKPVKLIDADANKDGLIDEGLDEIAAADQGFEVNGFMEGAKYAFEMIVTAYSKGDRAPLKPLLSSKLYADFEASITLREAAGQKSETVIHLIKSARIVAAQLRGAMAYITVDYDVEQTTVTRDKTGAVVEGSPDRIASVEDVWTFSRDIRSSDPNWTLIETSTTDK
jgi:predicted lipid-binding transport protein (Tim44 family)